MSFFRISHFAFLDIRQRSRRKGTYKNPKPCKSVAKRHPKNPGCQNVPLRLGIGAGVTFLVAGMGTLGLRKQIAVPCIKTRHEHPVFHFS